MSVGLVILFLVAVALAAFAGGQIVAWQFPQFELFNMRHWLKWRERRAERRLTEQNNYFNERFKEMSSAELAIRFVQDIDKYEEALENAKNLVPARATIRTLNDALAKAWDATQVVTAETDDQGLERLVELECKATSPKTGEKCQRAAVHSGMHFFYDGAHDQTVEWL